MQIGTPVSAVRAHEEMFAYWASRRQGGRLPGRASIQPDHFKRHLPTISLIDVFGDPPDYRLRLAGTGLYGVYGREITGQRLQDVYVPPAGRRPVCPQALAPNRAAPRWRSGRARYGRRNRRGISARRRGPPR